MSLVQRGGGLEKGSHFLPIIASIKTSFTFNFSYLPCFINTLKNSIIKCVFWISSILNERKKKCGANMRNYTKETFKLMEHCFFLFLHTHFYIHNIKFLLFFYSVMWNINSVAWYMVYIIWTYLERSFFLVMFIY